MWSCWGRKQPIGHGHLRIGFSSFEWLTTKGSWALSVIITFVFFWRDLTTLCHTYLGNMSYYVDLRFVLWTLHMYLWINTLFEVAPSLEDYYNVPLDLLCTFIYEIHYFRRLLHWRSSLGFVLWTLHMDLWIDTLFEVAPLLEDYYNVQVDLLCTFIYEIHCFRRLLHWRSALANFAMFDIVSSSQGCLTH